MDGTFYLGDGLIPGASEFIDYIKKQGRDYFFFTNNSSHDARECCDKLERIGYPVPEEKIIISSHVATEYINTFRRGKRVYLLGNANLTNECKKAGLDLVDDAPDIVLLGFDTTLTYEKITKASNFIASGCEYMATHPDVNCPMPVGFMTDTGAMIEMFKASSGRYPDKIFGKPHAYTVDYVMRKLNVTKDEICFIGDRLETDIAIGDMNDAASILVYTGVTTPEMYRQSKYRATLDLPCLGDVIKYI